MELMSSWEQGGALEEAAILKGRRKQEMRISSCSTYSSSASTMRNTRLKWQTEISRLMRSRSEMQNLLMPALLCHKEKDIAQGTESSDLECDSLEISFLPSNINYFCRGAGNQNLHPAEAEARLDNDFSPLTSSSFACSQRGGILCNFPQSVSIVAWDYASCILLLCTSQRHLPPTCTASHGRNFELSLF